MAEQKKTLKDLKKFYETVAACNRCGFCTSYCPTYNATGSESQSPRGRNQAFRALIEGKVANPIQTKEIIDSCLLCGECTSVCFSEVPTANLMIQARHIYNEKYGIPAGVEFVLKKLLANPKGLQLAMKLAFLGKRLGISWVLRKLGILKRVAPAMDAADRLVKNVPLKFFLENKETFGYQDRKLEVEQHEILVAQKKMFDYKRRGKTPPDWLVRDAERRPHVAKIAFMPVCGSQYVKPEISLATFRLFQKLKVDFHIPSSLCCGLPAASYGVLDQVVAFAKKNIEMVERAHFQLVVCDDSSCLAHFKDYPQYFRDDPDWFERAHAFVQKIRDLPQFFQRYRLGDLLSAAKWTGGPVAYHDPCKAQYAQKTIEPPRELLRAIPGLKLVEVAEADQCCGGGGTYSFMKPEISQEVLSKKVQHIVKSGAKTVVTSSTSCMIQLASGISAYSSKIKVYHLSEFLWRVMEGKKLF